MEVAGMNKENGPTKLVPIINTPLLLTNTWSFRHFSRYLCYPMLILMELHKIMINGWIKKYG